MKCIMEYKLLSWTAREDECLLLCSLNEKFLNTRWEPPMQAKYVSFRVSSCSKTCFCNSIFVIFNNYKSRKAVMSN